MGVREVGGVWRRRVGWLAAVAVVGLGACGGGGDDEPDEGPGGPVALEDHWHAAFGVYVCDRFLPAGPEFESAEGIHTHGDGVIHVHPFVDEVAGEGARLGVFLDGAGIEVAEDGVTVDGREHAAGEGACGDGEPAAVTVLRWADVAGDGGPEAVDPDEARFLQDGEGYVVAVAPAGADVPVPESASRLDELGSIDAAPTATAEPEPEATAAPEPEAAGPAGEGADVADGFYPVEAMAPPPCGDGQWPDPAGDACYALADRPAVGVDAVETADAAPGLQGTDGSESWQVGLTLSEDGIEAFNTVAATCFDRAGGCPLGQLALVVDGEVVFAPAIQEPSFARDAITVSGAFDEDEARSLADAVTGGR